MDFEKKVGLRKVKRINGRDDLIMILKEEERKEVVIGMVVKKNDEKKIIKKEIEKKGKIGIEERIGYGRVKRGIGRNNEKRVMGIKGGGELRMKLMDNNKVIREVILRGKKCSKEINKKKRIEESVNVKEIDVRKNGREVGKGLEQKLDRKEKKRIENRSERNEEKLGKMKLIDWDEGRKIKIEYIIKKKVIENNEEGKKFKINRILIDLSNKEKFVKKR